MYAIRSYYVEDRYAGDEWTLVELALRYVDLDQDARAVSILRGILKDHPKHIDANMQLGTIYYRMGQTRLGKRHWQAAETQARQENRITSYNVCYTKLLRIYRSCIFLQQPMLIKEKKLSEFRPIKLPATPEYQKVYVPSSQWVM